MPLFNDEDHVARAIDSALSQTEVNIEVVCVDDASTDRTADIAEEYARRDARVRVLRQARNGSAFQARRIGIDAALAPFTLFLDGDDELDQLAVATTLSLAQSAGADLVGFGVQFVDAGAGIPSRMAAALQPKFAGLDAPAILPGLFPPGQPANGHLWRFLFATELLRRAYEGLPANERYYRANDLPITFLAVAHARKYVSTPQKLYRYAFGRGTSGHAVDGVQQYDFMLQGIDPISAARGAVDKLAAQADAVEADVLLRCYDSARLSVIGAVLKRCVTDVAVDLQSRSLELLKERAGNVDLVRAAAAYTREALRLLSANAPEPVQRPEVKNVLLTTRHLGTGGLQAVLREQAAQLVAAGFRVVIVVENSPGGPSVAPLGVEVIALEGNSRLHRLDHWRKICLDYAIDVVIDHYILYQENWPWFALAALSVDVPTIGWLHSFSLRGLFDQSQRTSFLARHLQLLLNVVTLSAADVAFWKLQGLERVCTIPNPNSALTRMALEVGRVRTLTEGPIELAWWGRLDGPTKQVQQLLDAAVVLKKRRIDFRLTIIGPDSRNLTASQLAQKVRKFGIESSVNFVGESSAEEMLHLLADVHLLVSTSAIEGYQLTIVEAHALGIPVVMYELPWLTVAAENDAVVSTPPGDVRALAGAIEAIASDPVAYEQLSKSALAAGSRLAGVDVESLTVALVRGELPTRCSPEPTNREAGLLVEWLVRYAERNIRRSVAPAAQKESPALAAVRRDLDRTRRKLDEVMSGPSFRIGRAITAIPRFLRTRARPGRVRVERAPDLHRAKVAASAQPFVSAAPVGLAPSAEPPAPLRRQVGGAVPQGVASPDVTFVIPVYNSAQWLEDCVNSVLAQTGVDLEVICVDDGSTDDSLRLLRDLAEHDARLTVVEQRNSGQSVARNRGLDLARGRFLIYLDSDDYWPSDVLAGLVRRADAEDLDILLFDCLAFRDGDVEASVWERYAKYYQRKRAYCQVHDGVALMSEMRKYKEYRPHVGLYLARTSFVRSSGVRFIPGIVHQDNPYTFRLLLAARRASHERVDAYARRLRPGSTITTLTSERSARGYFLSYVDMSRALVDFAWPEDTERHVMTIVDSVFQGAQNRLGEISESEAAAIAALDTDPDAAEAFRSMTAR